MKIYMVEFHHFYYKDPLDNEDVEDKYTIGYFSSFDLALDAIKACIIKGHLKKQDFKIIDYEIELKKHQKYVYVLNYEFSILKNDGGYEDYYYKFTPCTSEKQCAELKEKLIKTGQINKKENAIYDVSSDGFYIDKIKINFINTIYF